MFDFVQKHFVSATNNVSQFAQPKKHHGQQCVLVYQGFNFAALLLSLRTSIHMLFCADVVSDYNCFGEEPDKFTSVIERCPAQLIQQW